MAQLPGIWLEESAIFVSATEIYRYYWCVLSQVIERQLTGGAYQDACTDGSDEDWPHQRCGSHHFVPDVVTLNHEHASHQK